MIDGNYTLHVPEQHPCYAGHFPDKPVVPAALLLQWLQTLLEDKAPGHQLNRVSSLKFLTVIEPGDKLELRCQAQTGGKVKLSVFHGETLACKGSVHLKENTSS